MPNFPRLSRLLKKPIVFSFLGINALVALPLIAQSYYPPMVFFQPLAYPNYPQRNENSNLADSLASGGNFKNLVAEVEEAGLTKELKQQKFTVLAPNDEAFNALPDEVFDKFSEPKNRLKVLQYHLIPGEVTAQDIKRGEVTTLTGEAIAISQQEGNLTINDAQTTFPSTVATNGVIIEIDRVLLPPDF